MPYKNPWDSIDLGGGINIGGKLWESGGNFVDSVKGGYSKLGEGVVDFFSDPTGRKAAADDMRNIYEKQMAENTRRWDDYTNNFSGINQPANRAATDFLNADYSAQLPGAERFQNQLNNSDYYYPDAQKHQNSIQYDRYGAMVPEAQQYQFDPFSIEEDAGYKFAREQGEDAISRRAAAGSGSLGPATTKAMAEFNTGLASQYANDAFSRWQNTQNMNQGASRDYRSDQLGNIGMWYGMAGDKETRNYGYGRDFRGDQMANVNQQWTVDPYMQNLDYTYGNQYFQDRTGRALNDYNMGQGQANFGIEGLGMQNPLGYMNSQNAGTQGLANAAQAGGGNALWDWLNLGASVGKTVAPFI